MNQEIRDELDGVFLYAMECDLRILAFQATIPGLLRQNDEQKEAFYKDLEKTYERLRKIRMGDLKKKNYKLYLKAGGVDENRKK